MKHCGNINLWEIMAKPIHAAAQQMMKVVHGKGTIVINQSLWMRWKIISQTWEHPWYHVTFYTIFKGLTMP